MSYLSKVFKKSKNYDEYKDLEQYNQLTQTSPLGYVYFWGVVLVSLFIMQVFFINIPQYVNTLVKTILGV